MLERVLLGSHRPFRPAAALWLLLAPLGCAPPRGDVSVLVEPESTILGGIAAGSELDAIQDGWSVTFSKYIVALGPMGLRHVADGTRATGPARFALDLAALSTRGEELWTLTELDEGRWDLFFATELGDLERHDSVDEDDFDTLLDAEATHFLVGELASESGRSCPPRSLASPAEDAEVVGQNGGGDDCYAAPSVSFSLLVRAEVTYGPCEIDGVPGVAVQAGRETSAAISMHGDHLFFGGFPEGSEGEVRRYAQWLADCDLNLDGVVVAEELAGIPPAELHEFDDRFPLGGSPKRPVDSMLTYVESQLSTQGHFEGEGECALDFDPLELP